MANYPNMYKYVNVYIYIYTYICTIFGVRRLSNQKNHLYRPFCNLTKPGSQVCKASTVNLDSK